MQIKITKCPDKKFRPYVTRALNFYGSELIKNKRIYSNIILNVKFTKTISAFGYTSVEGFNSCKKPREFLIEIHPGIGARNILDTLAHEMVHMKQFINNELNYNVDAWYGLPVDTEVVDYYSLPWEIEAYGREVGLFARFATQEKLWEKFEGIINPDEPIQEVELGWKI